ncbi:MAG: TetR/AcrR family transcriptional regulator [Bacteroidota bacterium]
MSPRSTEQFEAIREKSRNKILMAALELFAHQGYHNTSVSQIAKKAEVAKGLVYNYFASKEALLEGIILKGMGESQVIFEKIAATPTSKGKMEQIILITCEYLVERYDYYKLLMALSLQLDQFPQLRDMIQARFKSMLPFLSMLMSDLGFEDPQSEALKLGALMDGMGLQYMVLKDAFPLEEMKAHLLKTYCK